jgi:nitroimidazol reductase NimA-like FMN-containing flavoprotein (pyridoxamine 5'-phosphate oxidase superfamily)
MYRSMIPAWECYELLSQQRVGRLGIIEYGSPISIPVSYRLTGTHSDGPSARVWWSTFRWDAGATAP